MTSERATRRAGAALALIGLGLVGLYWGGDEAAPHSVGAPAAVAHLEAPPREAPPAPTVDLGAEGAEGADVPAGQALDPRTVPGELMLRFAEGVDPEAFAAEHGLELRGVPEHGDIYLLGADQVDERALLRALEGDPRVLEGSPNGRIAGAGTSLLGYQWHLGQVSAWGEQSGSRDVRVAVVDSGIATSVSGCTALTTSVSGIRAVKGADYVRSADCGYDKNQHGTHIASTIASYDNEVWGTGPGLTVVSYRVLGADNRGTEYALLQALQAILANAANIDLVNMSLAFGTGYVPSDELQAVIDDLAAANVIMVGAAGNDGATQVSWPAAHPEVIAVGALCRTSSGGVEVAPYSNTGPQIDVMAPGGCLDRDTNGDGYKDGILAATIGTRDPASSGWWWMAGTSQAAATVSGIIGVILGQGLDPADIRYSLHRGASLSSTATWTAGQGAGPVNMNRTNSEAWSAPWSGLERQPVYHVAMMPYLLDNGNGTVSPRAELAVLDESGAAVTGVTVLGAFDGSTSSRFSCTLSSTNTCTATGTAISWSSTASLSWKVQVGMVLSSNWNAAPARAVMFVDDDLQSVYAGLRTAGKGDALLAWEWASETVSGVRTKAAYTIVNQGSGISTSPFGVILSSPALDSIATIGSATSLSARLSNTGGTGISTSPFGYRVITLDSGGTIVALDGSGISTSPFGARSVLLPDTGTCSACVTSRSALVDLETAEISGSTAVLAWSVSSKIDAGGWVTSSGVAGGDVVATSTSSTSATSAGSLLTPIRHP